MMIDPKVNAAEKTRLYGQFVSACNEAVLSTRLTQQDREDLLARMAAFATTRLEQCLAEPILAQDLIADHDPGRLPKDVRPDRQAALDAKPVAEPDSEDLSFLD